MFAIANWHQLAALIHYRLALRAIYNIHTQFPAVIDTLIDPFDAMEFQTASNCFDRLHNVKVVHNSLDNYFFVNVSLLPQNSYNVESAD